MHAVQHAAQAQSKCNIHAVQNAKPMPVICIAPLTHLCVVDVLAQRLQLVVCVVNLQARAGQGYVTAAALCLLASRSN
jgi:hypothetical protein